MYCLLLCFGAVGRWISARKLDLLDLVLELWRWIDPETRFPETMVQTDSLLGLQFCFG